MPADTLSADGRAVVALDHTNAPLPYVERSHLVLRAAHDAGLGYTQHIVVVAALTSPPTTPTAADGPPAARDDDNALQMALLVFASHAGRGG